MRWFMLLTFVVCTSGYAQDRQTAAIAPNGKLPAIYKIDDTLLNDKAAKYFTIKDVQEKKIDAKVFPVRDTICIKLTRHQTLNNVLQRTQVSLSTIAAQNIAGYTQKSQVVYLRNDTLLTVTRGVKISSLKIFLVKVVRAAKTSYYANFGETTFLYIYTIPVPFNIR